MSTWTSMTRCRMRSFLGAMLLLAVTGVAYASTGTVTYVYTDPQGTPLAEADASGNITATYDYAPYGSQALGAPPSGPGYTGHVNDPESGLVYMQARYYDPVVGRFLSVDPVGPGAGDVFTFNRFAYVDNNPIVRSDPTGRAALVDALISTDVTPGGSIDTINCKRLCVAANQSGGSANLLGKSIPIHADNSVTSSNQSRVVSKVGAAISKLDKTPNLTSEEERITKNINSITISAAAQRSFVNETTGNLTLLQSFVESSSLTWLGSSIAHDGFHVEQYRTNMPSRGLGAEVGAMRFQEGVAFKMGMKSYEANYLQTLIFNPEMLRAYIQKNP